ncbi:MAG: hypothetical protein G01um10143_630 [Parcubacteria group bacterium Gr01-1014_3]|nr:MAG: hypothetical protein G01um10143_630 [Parcubacteria group bacterium Gr01-1014_3]
MKTLFFIIISTALAGWVFLYGLPEDVANKAKTAISELKAAPAKVKEAAEDFLSTPAEKREKVISKLETKLVEVKTTSTIPKSFAEEAEKLITDLRAKNDDKPSLLSSVLTKAAESILPAQFLSSEPVNCEDKK